MPTTYSKPNHSCSQFVFGFVFVGFDAANLTYIRHFLSLAFIRDWHGAIGANVKNMGKYATDRAILKEITTS